MVTKLVRFLAPEDRLIPTSVALACDPDTMRALRRAGYVPPIAGADPDPDPDPTPDPEPDPELDPAWTPPTKEQFDAMQEAIAASNRKARDLEKKVEKASTTSKAEAGQFKELYEAETAKTQALVDKVGSAAVQSKVAEVAGKLGFKNPAVAHKLLDLSGIEANVDADSLASAIDAATETLIEGRLAALAKSDEYLVKAGGGRQVPRGDTTNPGDGGGNAEMNARIRAAAGR